MHLVQAHLHPERYPHGQQYPFHLDVLHKTLALEFKSPVTFFIGDNGTGKSTLLRAIARKCGIFIWGEGKEMSHNEEKFLDALSIEWANGPVHGSLFSSELFFNFSRIADDDEAMREFFGNKSFGTQSHGEGLISYFKSRYRIPGVYFLDEPETALSPRSQLELLKLIHRMSCAGHSQFIIVSHSPILLACPGACLYSFDQVPIKVVDYEQTDYFKVYRDFMQNRDMFTSLSTESE
jgi:predicted ATPase